MIKSMKKKLMVLGVVLMAAMIYASNDAQDNQQVWLEESTQDYDYKREISFEPFTKDEVLGTNIETISNVLNSGLVRTKTTKELADGKIKITKDIWTTKNPDYAAWLKYSLAAAGVLILLPDAIYNLNNKSMSRDNKSVIRKNKSVIRNVTDPILLPVDLARGTIDQVIYGGKVATMDFQTGTIYYGDRITPVIQSIPNRLYNFATDPLVATAVGGMAAYYLYQKYMASQKKAQPEEDVKNEDADNKVAD